MERSRKFSSLWSNDGKYACRDAEIMPQVHQVHLPTTVADNEAAIQER